MTAKPGQGVEAPSVASPQSADTVHSWPVFARPRALAGFPRLERFGGSTEPAAQTADNAAPDGAAEQRREPSPAEQQALREATEAGYAAGLESGQQAAIDAQARTLADLQRQCTRVQEQLQSWSALLEQTFAERCFQALEAILGERLQVQPDFFAELLQQAARELHSDIDSLQLEVASDLERALSDDIAAVVNAELDPGEIRIAAGARVAQLPIAELVAEMLADLPVVGGQNTAEHSNAETDENAESADGD